jgi:glycosyl transferase family 25
VNALPPIWIISLRRATDRRETVAAAFRQRRLPFEFVDAVDGRALTDAERAQYSHWRALFHMGRGLSKGHFGASLAHLRVYERMVAEQVPVVAVFEDDVEPLPELRTVLEALDALPADWQVVTLHSLFSWAGPEPVDDWRIAGDHRVCRYRRTPFGAQGYLITLDGARRLLEVGYPVALPCDELLFRRWPASLVRYGIEPPVLVHRDVTSEIHRRPECVIPDRPLRRPVEWAVVIAGKAWYRLRRSAARLRDDR